MPQRNLPIACSLDAGDLRRRLDEIEALGRESLSHQRTDHGTQVLHFRPDPATRERLERIVAAEAECCPFLDLDLRQEDAELVLKISASDDAAPVADELARAFGDPQMGQADAPGA